MENSPACYRMAALDFGQPPPPSRHLWFIDGVGDWNYLASNPPAYFDVFERPLNVPSPRRYHIVMRHRRFIIAQATLSVVIAVISMFSYVTVPTTIVRLSSGDFLTFVAYEGRGRIFILHSERPMLVSKSIWSPGFVLRSQDQTPPLPADLAGPQSEPSFRTTIRLGGRNDLPMVGGAWRVAVFGTRPPPLIDHMPIVESSFIRFPLWPLAIMLMYMPVRRAYVERRQARRKLNNQCLECGYDLYGIASSRCPECGAVIGEASGSRMKTIGNSRLETGSSQSAEPTNA